MANTKQQFLNAYKTGNTSALRELARQLNRDSFKADSRAQPVMPQSAQAPVVVHMPAIEPRQVTDNLHLADFEQKRAAAVIKASEAAQKLHERQTEILESEAKNRQAMAQFASVFADALVSFSESNTSMMKQVSELTATVASLKATVAEMANAVARNAEGSKRAIELLQKPKRIIREGGKIIGIETGSNS